MCNSSLKVCVNHKSNSEVMVDWTVSGMEKRPFHLYRCHINTSGWGICKCLCVCVCVFMFSILLTALVWALNRKKASMQVSAYSGSCQASIFIIFQHHILLWVVKKETKSDRSSTNIAEGWRYVNGNEKM